MLLRRISRIVGESEITGGRNKRRKRKVAQGQRERSWRIRELELDAMVGLLATDLCKATEDLRKKVVMEDREKQTLEWEKKGEKQ